jgi:hypothetical protein
LSRKLTIQFPSCLIAPIGPRVASHCNVGSRFLAVFFVRGHRLAKRRARSADG